MIRLNCFVQVSAENRAELLAIAKDLVAKSLNDKGCIAYDVFESATRPEVLMICETWTDAACLDVHMHAPHFTELVPKIEALGQMKIEQFTF